MYEAEYQVRALVYGLLIQDGSFTVHAKRATGVRAEGHTSRLLVKGAVLALTERQISAGIGSFQIQIRGPRGLLCRNAFVEEFSVSSNALGLDHTDNWALNRHSPHSPLSPEGEDDDLAPALSVGGTKSSKKALELLSTSGMVEPGIFRLDFSLPKRAHLYECRVLINGASHRGFRSACGHGLVAGRASDRIEHPAWIDVLIV